MKWISFIVKALLIGLVFWLIFIYGYGDFFLVDSIVPEKGTAIDEWMDSYYLAGTVSAIVGIVCGAIWFYFGTNFSGEAGISAKFYILLIASVILGFAAAFALILSAVEGSGLSLLFAWLIAPLTYYVITLIDSAEAVKFIPPLGDKVHR